MASPYWYWRQLKNNWVIDENTTNRFDLPEQGHVSGLAVTLLAKNETNLENYDDPYFVQRISKLRIVGNGNYPIMDLHGKFIHAMNFWDRGTMSHDELQLVDAENQTQYIYIPFGQYMGDPDYGLKLENFSAGVQWEETNNISTTYLTDAYNKVSVYALMRKNPEPNLFSKGYLRKREIIKKDANSETAYAVKLPTNNKLRQIHIFSEPTVTSGSLSTTWYNVVYNIFLSIKSKEEYLLDNFFSKDWARYIHDYAGREAETTVRFVCDTAGAYYDTMIAERVQTHLTNMNTTAYMPACPTATDTTQYARFYPFNHDGNHIGGKWWKVGSKGICMHGDIPLLTVKPDAPEEEWLDAGENKDVYVEVTENSSAGNWYIVLDELEKTYPS
ncbi:MAG: hypothetical protein KKD77_22965 [Gammaproteobacteria bacterium]|nr:hypothetical protein [Gammaproteobacteria bacterium]